MYLAHALTAFGRPLSRLVHSLATFRFIQIEVGTVDIGNHTNPPFVLFHGVNGRPE